MGVAYNRMAGSLQQSLNMMQQMNGARAQPFPASTLRSALRSTTTGHNAEHNGRA
jgi:hypothetical protein